MYVGGLEFQYVRCNNQYWNYNIPIVSSVIYLICSYICMFRSLYFISSKKKQRSTAKLNKTQRPRFEYHSNLVDNNSCSSTAFDIFFLMVLDKRWNARLDPRWWWQKETKNQRSASSIDQLLSTTDQTCQIQVQFCSLNCDGRTKIDEWDWRRWIWDQDQHAESSSFGGKLITTNWTTRRRRMRRTF